MQKKHIITIGGFPGSGKSTVKRLLAEKLGYKSFSTGDYVRKLAVERGMTLEAFNELVATSKDIDLMIDAELERIEREDDNYIIDSHLAFHFVPSGFSVFLMSSLKTSAQRIFNDKLTQTRIETGDTMETYEEAETRTEKRIMNHKDRYMRHYAVDPYIPEQYTFTIDSEKFAPEKIVEMILTEYTEWLAE